MTSALERVPVLTNFRMDSRQRLCLLLVGLTELHRRLKMAVHASRAQRIIGQQHCSGLARDELEPYLAHRLRLAGCELPLLEPSAIEVLFQSSRGKSTCLAHFAHTANALAQARSVSGEHLEQACTELQC